MCVVTLLDREVLPTNISARGILYSTFLLLLVVSLFFIPEIVRFQESVTKSKGSTSIATSSGVDIEDIIPNAKKAGSLDAVWSMVNGGYLEGQSDEIAVPAPDLSASSLAEEGTDPALSVSGGSLKDIQDRVFLEKTFSNGQVTWEQLTSSQVRRAFKSAQTSAIKILKGLGERQSAVRFALVNYINGLGWLARGDKKMMSAEEALAYIEQLDINVTQAMLTSEIDAKDFEQWKRISFGPLSANSRASAFKMNHYIAFNPRMTLGNVEIQKDPDYVQKRNGSWVRKNPRSSVRIEGFVMGKDVKKIVVYRNARRASSLKVSSKGNEDGLRTFKWRYRTAEGLFTFRAISRDGDVFEKSYVFLPRVYGRFKQDADGFFRLPFGIGDEDGINLRNLDTRLDRFFRAGSRGASSESQGFDTF